MKQNKIKKVFDIQIRFVQPGSGILRVLAVDEAEAVEILEKQMSDMKELEVIDIFDEEKIASKSKEMREFLDSIILMKDQKESNVNEDQYELPLVNDDTKLN